MTEKEKKLIAYRLKSVSRKDLVDILKLSNFKVYEIERLDIDTKLVDNVRNTNSSERLATQILSLALDISDNQASDILRNHKYNTNNLSVQQMVERICIREGLDNKLHCVKAVKVHFDIGLKEAKDLVDEYFESLKKSNPLLSYTTMEQLSKILYGKDLEKKLECVKEIKNSMGLSLYEAKDLFEKYIEELPEECEAEDDCGDPF